MEEWRDVVGYEGLYQVSNQGRVLSTVVGIGRHSAPRILCQRPFRARPPWTKHNCVRLLKHGQRKYASVHRLVAKAFLPNPNNYPVVNHRDGNKYNNHVSNLEWVTYSENNLHALRTGLRRYPPAVKGEAHRSAKLTEDQVILARSLYKPNQKGSGHKALAKIFGLTPTAMRQLLLGHTWKHVQ